MTRRSQLLYTEDDVREARRKRGSAQRRTDEMKKKRRGKYHAHPQTRKRRTKTHVRKYRNVSDDTQTATERERCVCTTNTTWRK